MRCLNIRLNRTIITNEEIQILSKVVCTAIKKLQRERGNRMIYSVADLQKCENWSVDLMRTFLQLVVAAEYKTGISRKLFVRPKEKNSRNALALGLIQLPDMNTSAHDSMFEVLQEIEKYRSTSPDRRQARLGGLLEKIFSRFSDMVR